MANLVGLHDRQAVSFAPKDTWILDTISLAANQQPIVYSGDHHWIGRINWGYGETGTIPLKAHEQTLFIERFVRYVTGSKNCNRWIIGNEPNLAREWPKVDGILKPIYPDHYADLYLRCRNALYTAMGTGAAKYEVLIAGSGPWNNGLKYPGNEKGDWIKYFSDVINLCGDEWDGSAIHAYTHGTDPSLVWSEAKMEHPFEDRYYNFKTYLDYVGAIPSKDAYKPIYLTEANQDGVWKATGTMPAMADEIDNYNQRVRNKKIKCLIFYRWPKYDQDIDRSIEGKRELMDEFKQTVAKNYQTPTYIPSVSVPTPVVLPDPNTPKAIIKATILNVRDRPGTTETNVVDKKYQGDKISILEERIVNGSLWYRIGTNQWIIAEWAEKQEAPPTDNWERTLQFTAAWEGGFQDLDWDAGNWTGCEVGKGIKKGTNFGISACAYPNLDIRNLTKEQAKNIYFNDYWKRSGADQLPWPMCLLVFDSAVNFHPTTARAWLDQSKGNMLVYAALRLRGYRRSKAWPQAGNAWVDRMIDLMLELGEE